MPTRDDDEKTKEELLAEIEGLRRQLSERAPSADAAADAAPSQPAFARPMTRRTALGTWVAPVILSIPLAAVGRTRTAFGGQPPTMTPAPTLRPTVRPTLSPTLPPTMAPTAFPTLAPTVAPTAARVEAPALTSAGSAAAAAAAAGFGAARVLRGRKGEPAAAGGKPPERSDDDADDEGGTK